MASIGDATYKELQFTSASQGGTRTAFRLPRLDPAAPVYAFSARWNVTISGNFNSAADGFSFNYGALSSVNLTNPATTDLEKGYGIGLSFGVQTYSGGNPGFYLRADGAVLASLAYNPQTPWGVNSNGHHFFELDWHYTNGVTVRVDGQTICSNVTAYGFQPAADDRFVFAARTGGLAEDLRLDNIVVMSGGNLAPVATGAPYYADANSDPFAHDVTKAFAGANGTYWITFAANGSVGSSTTSAAPVGVYGLTSSTETGGGSGTDPRDFTLQGSTHSATRWAACASGSVRFVNRQESRSYLATNSTAFGAYPRYRFVFGPQAAGTSWQLGELRLFGDTLASLAPSLAIARSGGNVQITWPEAPDFTLERNPKLTPPWTTVTNVPGLSNGTNAVTLPAPGSTEFFRLRKLG